MTRLLITGGTLLDQGGDPYRRNELGESALARAEQNHPELLELIREKSAFRFPRS